LEYDVGKLLRVLKLSAQIILENGGETYRAEETIDFICKSFNVQEVESIATPTGIYISVSIQGNDNNTLVKRISKRTINLQKIHSVNNISRLLSLHSITLDEALRELEHIKNNNEKDKYSLLYVGLSSAFFTVLFGGGLLEFFTGLFAGILVGIISESFTNLHSYHFFSNTVSGAVIAFLAIAVTTLTKTGNYNPIIVGCMMPLLPGLAMTNAIRDTMRGDLISGMARTTEVLLVAASLAAGAGVVLYLAYTVNILS
jgi:uncharacterized membrane protein YjjP (DUF1212 family)